MDNKTLAGLQARLTKLMDEKHQSDRQAKHWQSKASAQKNEIARLNQVVERLMEDKRKLLADIKWMRGE